MVTFLNQAISQSVFQSAALLEYLCDACDSHLPLQVFCHLQVTRPRVCTVCVLPEGVPALPAATEAALPEEALVVVEKWLLSLAESFAIPSTDSPWIVQR